MSKNLMKAQTGLFLLAMAASCAFSDPGLVANTGGTLRVTSTNDVSSDYGGGLLLTPIHGPRIVVLNRQNAIPEDVLGRALKRIQVLSRWPIEQHSAKSETRDPRREVQNALISGASNTVAVVLLAQLGEGQPSLLVAPDDRWAIINVDSLRDGVGKGAEDKTDERVQKELWRALASTMGCAGSVMPRCVLGPVKGMKDLDGLAKGPGPDALLRISANARKIGVELLRLVTYRQAVEEGWAPQPTNDIQRAIWKEDRVK